MKYISTFFRITIVAVLCCSISMLDMQSANAQTVTPQYSYTNNATGGNYIPFGSGTWGPYRSQFLYLPGDFPTLTSTNPGFITSIYFKCYTGFSSASFSMSDLEVRIGNTTQTALTGYVSGLTTAYGPANYTAATSLSGGNWFEIPLTTPVYIDPTQPLVVDIIKTNTSGGIPVFAGGTPVNPTYTGNTHAYSSSSSGGASTRRYSYQFGFDFFGGFPCTDTPKTSIDGLHYVCPKKKYVLRPDSFYAKATYKWEVSLNNGLSWSLFTGPVGLYADITDSLTQQQGMKLYKLTVTCDDDPDLTWTTPIHKVEIAPFYYCYCDTRVRNDGSPDIGSITVIENTPTEDTVFSNGDPNPLYNNSDAKRSYTAYHDSLGADFPCMYRDTSYKFLIYQIHAGNTLQNGVLQAYLDLDRNGSYDPATERILIKAIDGTGQFPEIVDEDFTIPASANVGPTGLRFVLSSDTLQSVPCDTLDGSGEVEDYIVEICYRPCDGPVPAGIAEAADTTMCVGYDYLVTDTTYADTVSGYNWSWQVSGDNSVWFDIPNTNKKDTLQRVFGGQPLYYRLMTVCPNTDDTAYSNGRLVDLKPSYKCYCFSQADGLDKDTSDIGGVDFAGVFTYNGGPHVLNPMAKNKRQDYTDRQPIEIVRDSAYKFTVYHTMRSAIHGDAKITIFLDYNNDKEYNTPDERVYTGFTTIGNHTVIDNVVVPLTAIVDVPTGMRVILNNDIGPNVPSDEACGTYTSGETEDFIVIFRKKTAAGVEELGSSLNGFGLHPNPTNGKFMVQFSSADKVSDLRVRVTNLTGQEIYSEDYGSHKGGFFSQELSIEGQPSGVYFVELQADGQQIIRKLVLQ